MALRNPQHAFSKTLSDEHLATHSGSSSSSAASAEREVVHLTPDFDSDEGADDGVDDDDDDSDSDSDLDMGMGMGMGMRGGERAQNDSYKMQRWQPVHREKGEFKELKKADLDLDVDVDMDSDEDSYRDETRRRRRGSFSTVQSYQLYTPDEERTVVRKFDRKLVVFVALLYMLSFLDRSNIGNAKIAGLERDLHLDSNKYEWVVTAFYIAYICFEWMRLLVLRTLLGIGEAGFTGIPFYLSFFFKREELAFRTGIFLSAAPLATSFASSLAWGIVKLGERSPIAPWRLLFLVEGFPSVLVALFAWHHIPDSPNTASYLTTREKKIARLRLRHEVTSSPSAKTTPSSGLKIREVFLTFRDPKVYLTALMFFFSNMAFSSMPIFLPTILTHMGHSASTSQALSAPPYLLSFFSVLLTSYLSDKFCSRSPFLIFHALLSSLGYTLLALPPHFISPSIRYLAIYPACVGFFCVITILITWTLNNQPSSSRQGTGFAIMQMVGQCGPLVGTRLYPETQAPYYTEGMGVCAGVMFGVAGLGWGLRWWLGRENQRSGGRYGRLGGEGEGEDEEERGLVANENGNGKVKSRRDGKISFLYML
ncbi:transporter C1683.12-like protein 3 [Botrytis cinerea]